MSDKSIDEKIAILDTAIKAQIQGLARLRAEKWRLEVEAELARRKAIEQGVEK